MSADRPHRTWLGAVFQSRCPRCREGKLFVNKLTWRYSRNLKMHQRCPVCGQITDIEVGFYYGTAYISYLLGIFISVFSFLLWLLTIGFSFNDYRFAIWLSSNAVLLILLQPWMMRFSRVIWLSFFVKYDPDWENHPPDDPERIVEEHMNNW